MTSPFLLALGILFLLAAVGVPIAFGTFAGAIFYFFATDQDPGLVVEQSLNGLFDSYVLLAVPLFIIAANFMNAGTVSDRLLSFCRAVVGRMTVSGLVLVAMGSAGFGRVRSACSGSASAIRRWPRGGQRR